LHNEVPAFQQDQRFATKAPMIRKSVVLTEESDPAVISLVVSINGTDRHGIVRSLAERAQRYNANWTASRMTRLAGHFAGMVHLEVPRENADALENALRGLESSGLQVIIARSDSAKVSDAVKPFELELVGEDRVGIVSRLTTLLADRGVSIEQIHTEIIGGGQAGKQTFKVGAQLLVPAKLSVEDLKRELAPLAQEMVVDIALGEKPAAAQS
jgi:glycine cleavage system regulatory protein